jgi:UDPglucose 6-dehydrogenase
VIVTEWPQLSELPLAEAKAVMRTALVIDGRNLLDPEEVRGAGFTYEGVGRVESVFAGLPETAAPEPELEQQ